MKQLLGLLCCCWIFLVLPLQAQSSEPLEALLIIGFEPHGDIREEKFDNMNKVADLLEEHGFIVHQYYHRDATWNNIVATAKKCHILVYAGHGAWLGENGKAGGLSLNPYIVSSATMLQEMQLQDNALIVFESVCLGAGSTAGDDGDIGIEEARDRVRHYANPFFHIGGAAYYANNYSTGTFHFLSDFLNGIPLQESFKTFANKWSDIEFEEPFDFDPTKLFSIASRQGTGTAIRTTYVNGVKTVREIPPRKSYCMAYVGAPNYSIEHLKGTAKEPLTQPQQHEGKNTSHQQYFIQMDRQD